MRYHWGLGVGHCYAHNTSESSSTSDEPSDIENDQCADLEPDNTSTDSENASDTYESDNSELYPDGWDDVETSDSASGLYFPSEEGSDSEVDD